MKKFQFYIEGLPPYTQVFRAGQIINILDFLRKNNLDQTNSLSKEILYLNIKQNEYPGVDINQNFKLIPFPCGNKLTTNYHTNGNGDVSFLGRKLNFLEKIWNKMKK